MKGKPAALLTLGALSLVCPAMERIFTGNVDPFSPFGIAETFLSLVPIFWWYHTDKAERNYRGGPLMNAGVLMLAVVALPVYFIRSRGWKGGAIATLLAAAVFGVTLVLGEIGEWIGGLLR